MVVLEHLVQTTNKTGCPLVLAGDVFNKNRPVSWVVGETQRLLRQVPEVWFIQGNHDKDRERAWLTIVETCQHLDPVMAVDVGGHQLVGIDYRSMEEFGEALGQVPKGVDGLVCHQAFKQALSFDDAWNADLDIMEPDRVRNLWVGDIHSPIECWSHDRQIRAVYSGCLWPMNIDETKHEHRAVLVEDTTDENGHYQYRSLRLPKRPVVSLTLEDEQQLKAALEDSELANRLCPDMYEDLDPRLREPVLHVRYPSDVVGVEDAFSALQKALGGGFYIETTLPARESFVQVSFAKDMGDEPMTFPQLLAKDLEGEEGPVRGMALELANCTSIEQAREVIGSWRTKVLGDVQPV